MLPAWANKRRYQLDTATWRMRVLDKYSWHLFIDSEAFAHVDIGHVKHLGALELHKYQHELINANTLGQQTS